MYNILKRILLGLRQFKVKNYIIKNSKEVIFGTIMNVVWECVSLIYKNTHDLNVLLI